MNVWVCFHHDNHHKIVFTDFFFCLYVCLPLDLIIHNGLSNLSIVITVISLDRTIHESVSAIRVCNIGCVKSTWPIRQKDKIKMCAYGRGWIIFQASYLCICISRFFGADTMSLCYHTLTVHFSLSLVIEMRNQETWLEHAHRALLIIKIEVWKSLDWYASPSCIVCVSNFLFSAFYSYINNYRSFFCWFWWKQTDEDGVHKRSTSGIREGVSLQ